MRPPSISGSTELVSLTVRPSRAVSFLRHEHEDVLKDIRDTKKFEGEIKDRTVKALDAFAKQFA